MSALLEKHRYFLYLLSETESLKQQKALSDSITPEQFRALTQVVINALHLNIPLKDKVIEKLRKHRKLFTQLTDRNLSAKKRLLVFKKHYKTVIYLLKSALPVVKAITKET